MERRSPEMMSVHERFVNGVVSASVIVSGMTSWSFVSGGCGGKKMDPPAHSFNWITAELSFMSWLEKNRLERTCNERLDFVGYETGNEMEKPSVLIAVLKSKLTKLRTTSTGSVFNYYNWQNTTQVINFCCPHIPSGMQKGIGALVQT